MLTCRSSRLDDAFLSRFAVVLHFEPLSFAARRTLWARVSLHLFSLASHPSRRYQAHLVFCLGVQFTERAQLKLADADLDRLALFKMNGRDIQHAVRTAQAVALVNEERLGMMHFGEVLTVAKSGFEVEKQKDGL